MSDKPGAPYDQRLANAAAAVDHCLKLGGVVIQPQQPGTGFHVSPDHAPIHERGPGPLRNA